MRHPYVCAAAATAIAALAAAGCGSSNSSTNAAGAGATTSAAQNVGPYGEKTSAPAASTTTSATTSTGASAAATSAGAVLVSTKHDKLGTILAAGAKHLTVYMFEGDKGASSSCTGACAKVWPPVTTSGAPTAGGTAAASDLGTITRSDGTMQVTYKGHPLYYFARDGDAGDAYGQGVTGFGASWYVLSPSGKKVDNS